ILVFKSIIYKFSYFFNCYKLTTITNIYYHIKVFNLNGTKPAYALTLLTNLMIFLCACFYLAFLTDFSLDTALRALQFQVFFLRFLLKHRLELLPMYLLKVYEPPVFAVCFELPPIQTLQKQPLLFPDFYP